MWRKKFKTINEQVEILKNKGLIIEDENVVKDTLLRENYFFLMGYRHAFLISQKRKENSYPVQLLMKYTHYSHLIGILEI